MPPYTFRPYRSLAFVGLLAGSVLATCSSGDSSGLGAGGGSTDACHDCIAHSCASQARGCHTEPECALVTTCVTGCKGDIKCIDQCAAEYPSGWSWYSPLALCVQITCTDPCGASPPDGCGVIEAAYNQSNNCTVCMRTGCCPEGLTCSESHDCVAAAACVVACAHGDPECPAMGAAACKRMPGYEAWSSVSSCGATSCGDVCMPL